jgi:hypothetical protein
VRRALLRNYRKLAIDTGQEFPQLSRSPSGQGCGTPEADFGTVVNRAIWALGCVGPRPGTPPSESDSRPAEALPKATLSNVASKLTTQSAQDMITAMIAGERDPRVLANMAQTRMRAMHDALVEALTGMFDSHHGELAEMGIDQIASPPPRA